MNNKNSTMQEYYEALERLEKNKPINIAKGSKINKDTVALEAGRKRGAIRTDREVFYDLLEDIEKASKKQEEPKKEQQLKLDKVKEERDKYKKLYQEVINRELMYIEAINELEKKLNNNSLSSNNINYNISK